MSWETTDVLSADTTDVLSADTTDVADKRCCRCCNRWIVYRHNTMLEAWDLSCVCEGVATPEAKKVRPQDIIFPTETGAPSGPKIGVII